jgi:hypothetical protein
MFGSQQRKADPIPPFVKNANRTKLDPVLDTRSTYVSNQLPPTQQQQQQQKHRWSNIIFFFAERLPGLSRRRYFACGRILSWSNHMHSINQNDQSSGNMLGILCAPSYHAGAHKMIKAVFSFRMAFWPFEALVVLCMWTDPIMIQPHAKYHCRICVSDQALQLLPEAMDRSTRFLCSFTNTYFSEIEYEKAD